MAGGINPIANLPGKVDSQNRLVVTVSGGATGGTSAVDESAFAHGTDSGTPAMGYVGTDTVGAGAVGVFGMLDNRQAKVTLYDSSGVEVSVGGGTQYDRDTAAGADDKLTMAGVVRADSAASPVGADGDRSVLSHDASGRLYSRLEQQLDMDSGAGSAPTAVVAVGLPASGGPVALGGAAQDAAATSFNPVLTGGYASAAAPSDVSADGDAVRDWNLRNGARAVQITAAGALVGGDATNGLDADVTRVIPGTGATNLGKAEDGARTSGDVGVFALGVRNDTPNAATSDTNGDYTQVSVTSTGAVRLAPPAEDFAALANGPSVKKYYTNAGAVTDGIVWSPAAGTRWYVTDIFIGVSAACTVTLEDDLAAGDSAVFKMEFAANSGWAHTFATPLFSGEDAADLLITTTAGNVFVTITGYEI